ncbi:MAG: hypothetical protein ACLUD2_04725 [Clostridium sp.]
MPCEACMEPVDIYKDEQAAANHILAKIPYPSGERFMPTNPIRFWQHGRAGICDRRITGRAHRRADEACGLQRQGNRGSHCFRSRNR